MLQRSIRGAITVFKDTHQEIVSATTELLETMFTHNNLEVKDVVNIIFTATDDIHSCFPSVAAHKLGLKDIPLINAKELNINDSLNLCIRIMLTFNTEKTQQNIRHIYLKGAKVLRPDLQFDSQMF